MLVIAGKQQAPFPGIELPSTTVKKNSHLIYKNDSFFKWSLVSCMCGEKKGLCRILWNYSLDSKGGVYTNAKIICTRFAWLQLFQAIKLNLDSYYSCNAPPFKIPDSLFHKMAKPSSVFLVVWFWFELHESNQSIFPPLFFHLEYLDSSCQSTHGASIEFFKKTPD